MKRQPLREKDTMPMALLWGLVSGLAALLAGVTLCALLLTQKDMPPAAAVPIGTACLSAGAAVSGFVAARRRREQGLIVGGSAGLALWALNTLISLFVSGVEFTPVTPIRLALCLTIAALSGVLSVNLAARRRMPK